MLETSSVSPRLAPLTQIPRIWQLHVKWRTWVILGIIATMPGLAGSGEIQRRLVTVSLKTDMLAAHNTARRQVGLGPMVWSSNLAADAAAYARQMSRSQRFAHSRQKPGARPQGENLWMGTHNAFSYAEMAGSWVDEQRLYDGGSTDQALFSGTLGDTGHYTQIIWRRTRQVGCAVASNASDDYLVCRYLPAGNIMGSSPLD